MMDERIRQLAQENNEWIIGKRRMLHQTPERGFSEFKTQKIIMDALDEIGVPYTTERTWVIGLIEGGHPGKTIGLRADMDALPLEERSDLPFKSQNPGMMHACGHDAHVSMLLGAAKILWAVRENLHGNVKLFFQPAEETVGGAQPMIAAGCMENPHVDEAYGIHVNPMVPTGYIETKVGAMNAACDEIFVDIYGKSAHGAHPDGGIDAIVIAAQAITAVQQIPSRRISPTDSVIITFGSINGGTASNILCDCVKLHGTLRTLSPEMRKNMKDELNNLITGIARAMGGDAKVEFNTGYSALVNEKRCTEMVMRTGARMLGGSEYVQVAERSSMGGEDFGYFIEDIPGAFFNLGCTEPQRMAQAVPLHNNCFMLDENCLHLGSMMHAAVVVDAMEQA